MRKRFTYKDLEDSSGYFLPIFEAVFYANCKLYKTSELKTPLNIDNPRCTIQNYLSCGLDDFYNLFETINIYNRCFLDLLMRTEALVALPLIRLQLDNLTAIFAETLHPFQTLFKVYEEGKDLGKIKVDGKYIVPSELRKELDARFGTTISELYKKYSGFIHPSKSQKEVNMGGYYSNKKFMYVASKKDVRMYAKDMVYVNQIISNVLLAHSEDIKAKCK